jgi:hypothetical protein
MRYSIQYNHFLNTEEVTPLLIAKYYILNDDTLHLSNLLLHDIGKSSRLAENDGCKQTV